MDANELVNNQVGYFTMRVNASINMSCTKLQEVI